MSFLRSSIFRSTLFFFAGACTACAFFYFHYFSLQESKLDDASVRLLKERLAELGPLTKKQQKVLADEMIRVRRYERKLRTRAAALDALLNDTLELDPSRDEPLLEDISYVDDDGMGGGVESSGPILREAGNSDFARIKRKQSIFNYPLGILRVLDSQISSLRSVPIGSPSPGRRTSGFGYRRSPFSGRSQFHAGLDFAVDRKTPVISTANGRVKKAGYMRGYGLMVLIEHEAGFETLYAHLSKVLVKKGEKVCRGKRIGLVGNTGRSTGPHVHYEIRKDGKSVNPLPYVDLVRFLRLLTASSV